MQISQTHIPALVQVDGPEDDLSANSFFNLMVGDELVLREPVNCGFNPAPARAYAQVIQAVVTQGSA